MRHRLVEISAVWKVDRLGPEPQKTQSLCKLCPALSNRTPMLSQRLKSLEREKRTDKEKELFRAGYLENNRERLGYASAISSISIFAPWGRAAT